MEVTAFILAGGRSSRMGQDKSDLVLDGQTLLERAEKLARGGSDRVRVCGPQRRFGAAAVEDVFPGQGPLAGIHAGLKASETELNLILAVDTPFVRPEFLKILIAEAASSGAVVTVPFVGGRYHPLCGVYRREFAGLAESALRSGNNKIELLFPETSVRTVTDAEITKLAFDARMFDNLNTPADFERAQQRS